MILKDYVWADLRDALISVGVSWAVEPEFIERGSVGTLAGHPIFVKKTVLKTEGQIIDEENRRVRERMLHDIRYREDGSFLSRVRLNAAIAMIDKPRESGHRVVAMQFTAPDWAALCRELDEAQIGYTINGEPYVIGMPVRIGERTMAIINDEAG